MFRYCKLPLLRVLCAFVATSTASAQCERLPDGSWQCPRGEQVAQPTPMDVRVECPSARGSGTAVARLASGGTLIVTNHHVIRDQSRVTLHSGDGRRTIGQVAARDPANDLVAVAIDASWPIVNLGDDVTVGTPVQFRAYDAGLRFRKYFGNVHSEYQQAGSAGGYFATGASVAGNSGGGVYSRGQLVGVVWGNPNGGTAFIRIGPVRRLIEGVCRSHQRATPPSSRPSTPNRQSCDCDERWRQLESRLNTLTEQRPSPLQLPGMDWIKILGPALSLGGPIGVAIVAAGWLLRGRITRSERGRGGPRDNRFRERESGA